MYLDGDTRSPFAFHRTQPGTRVLWVPQLLPGVGFVKRRCALVPDAVFGRAWVEVFG